MTKMSLSEAFQGEYVSILSLNPGSEPLTTEGYFIDEDYDFVYLALSIAPGEASISTAVRKDKVTHVVAVKPMDQLQSILENAKLVDKESLN